MGGLSLVPFRGMMPRTAPRLLPEGAAVDATNIIITSGEIRPTRFPALVSTPSVSGPWVSIFRAAEGASKLWLAWSKDVDVLLLPLSPLVTRRWAWTGDGEPRHARFSDLSGTPFALGIPRPLAAPGVSHSGGTGAATTRVYVYTFYSQFNEESGDSPASALATGKVDGTWAITGMDAFPANSGTVAAVHSAGVTTFTNTGNHWLRVGDEIVLSGNKYLVSEVTSNTVFKVVGNFTGVTSWSRVAPWNTAGMKRRLYRSAGTTGSFQLVADDVGTSYNDTLTDAQILGDELISSGWEPPPTGLKGLREHPSGALVGFVGQQLCFSEPLQPHAWPQSLRRSATHNIVGLELFGSTVVIGTESIPYTAIGSEPASVTMDSVNKVWPCLAKRGMVAIDDGVLYPSTHGMVYIGMRGAMMWSDPFFTRTEWRPLLPDKMVSASTEGRVYVRYGDLTTGYGVLIFDLAEGDGGLTRLSEYPDELYADPIDGQLYLTLATGIHQFDSGIGARLNYSWRSKDFHLAKPVNFGAAKVDFVSEMTDEDFDAAEAAFQAAVAANVALVTGYRGVGGINGASLVKHAINASNIANIAPLDVAGLTFTLYADGRAVFATRLVGSDLAFKLGAGFKAATWAVGLTGAVRVNSVKVAETMAGLRDL